MRYSERMSEGFGGLADYAKRMVSNRASSMVQVMINQHRADPTCSKCLEDMSISWGPHRRSISWFKQNELIILVNFNINHEKI